MIKPRNLKQRRFVEVKFEDGARFSQNARQMRYSMRNYYETTSTPANTYTYNFSQQSVYEILKLGRRCDSVVPNPKARRESSRSEPKALRSGATHSNDVGAALTFVTK